MSDGKGVYVYVYVYVGEVSELTEAFTFRFKALFK